jgi:hypothetical protein
MNLNNIGKIYKFLPQEEQEEIVELFEKNMLQRYVCSINRWEDCDCSKTILMPDIVYRPKPVKTVEPLNAPPAYRFETVKQHPFLPNIISNNPMPEVKQPKQEETVDECIGCIMKCYNTEICKKQQKPVQNCKLYGKDIKHEYKQLKATQTEIQTAIIKALVGLPSEQESAKLFLKTIL